MGTATDKIKELRLEIERQEKLIKDCKHSWSKSKYDPETVQVPVYSHLEPCGSDPYPVYTYHPKQMDRWSRTCTTCGHTQYSTELVLVSTEKEPKF